MITTLEFLLEIKTEAYRILDWWRTYAPDMEYGGFYGEINQNSAVVIQAEKGGVLNGRILWAFSNASRHFGNDKDRLLAKKAFEYIKDHFIDTKYGGSFWSLKYDGTISNDRKQIYAIAFTIYGLSEYYKINRDDGVLQLATNLYHVIEDYSKDKNKGGYFEAFSRDWELLTDPRLSEKDRNDPKTMNTHLHIIEAYANLYAVWKDEGLRTALKQLLDVFDHHIIDRNTNHLILFFDENWLPTSKTISYGHDIEASWLLHDCAHILGDEKIEAFWKNKALLIADAATEGLQSDGSFIHEYDPAMDHAQTFREWWVSAEGMVGFVNAFKISGEKKYLKRAIRLWDFIKLNLLDKQNGEWYWGTEADYSKMDRYKMGFWKCPYHNVRACLEVIARLEK
ncbi:MAG: AGE family epimerase/isomerase [Saprospiraceae bacterium]